MSCKFFLFSIQALDKLDYEVLGFRIFSELAIFDFIRPGISNKKESMYVHVFIGIFILFLFLTNVYEDMYIRYCKIKEVNNVAHS